MPLSQFGGRLWLRPTASTPSNLRGGEVYRLSRVHDFCKKYGLSCESPRNDQTITDLAVEAIQKMSYNNFINKSCDDSESTYYRRDVLLDDEKILTGYFNKDQITDILTLDFHISLRKCE